MNALERAPIPGVPRTGDILDGKCRIEGVLGVGGMGVVLAARHLHLDRRVAVKLLLPEIASDTELVARFLQEGRAAARITSEHVAKVYDVATLPSGAPYMIMEYLEGQDLGQLLDARGALSVPEAVDYVLEACHALAEAHQKGIVHRDLKPSNLFLALRDDGSDCLKVLDFGISKLLSDPSSGEEPKMNITKTRSVLGSPAYMSPEQLRASKNVDARADIWGLGVILFELLSGSLPFDGQTVAELGAQVLAGSCPPLRADPPVPPGIDEAVGRCLRKAREERFAAVSALADALAPFATDRGRASAARIGGSNPRMSSSPAFTADARLRLGSNPEISGDHPALADTIGSFPQMEVVAEARAARSTRTYLLSMGALLVLGLALGGFALKTRATHRAVPPAPSALPMSTARAAPPNASELATATASTVVAPEAPGSAASSTTSAPSSAKVPPTKTATASTVKPVQSAQTAPAKTTKPPDPPPVKPPVDERFQ